jgi:hypothetical protein
MRSPSWPRVPSCSPPRTSSPLHRISDQVATGVSTLPPPCRMRASTPVRRPRGLSPLSLAQPTRRPKAACQSQSCAPSRSLTASTRSSTGSLQVCCALLPVMGFIVLPASDPQTSAEAALEDPDLSHGAIRTPRRIPLVGSRTASLRPLPPRRFFTAPTLRCTQTNRVRCAHRRAPPHVVRPTHTRATKAARRALIDSPAPMPGRGPKPPVHIVTPGDCSPIAEDTGRSPVP